MENRVRGYREHMCPPSDDPNAQPEVDPDAPGAYVDDEDAEEVPEPNEPA